MNIGQVIKKIRKEKGIKQGEFSKQCDITQTYLSLIESNRKQPNVAILKTIAENLDIPLQVLLFLSLDEEDIPERKKETYKALEPSIKGMINQIYVYD